MCISLYVYMLIWAIKSPHSTRHQAFIFSCRRSPMLVGFVLRGSGGHALCLYRQVMNYPLP